ncbi:hypothetical protein [Luteirhabdus pelagi]|uniref:hypothetical protein n=1 Tax=Luteirhabdus pelagi TaxID=2792783 RepID=UPI0019398A33|nr:hypothetical protein [Luteirhabdus pelagi]
MELLETTREQKTKDAQIEKNGKAGWHELIFTLNMGRFYWAGSTFTLKKKELAQNR